MDLRIHKNCPKCGAEMAGHNCIDTNKAGTHAQCRRCKVDYQVAYQRSKARTLKALKQAQRCDKRVFRSIDPVTGRVRSAYEADNTDLILSLVEQRDRCATHWEREPFTRRINELVAKQGEVMA